MSITYRWTNGGDMDFMRFHFRMEAFYDELSGGADKRTRFAPYNAVDRIHDVILAYDGDRPVGCAGFRDHGNGDAEIKRVWVDEEYRGRDISKEMMKRLEVRIRRRGYRRIILQTREQCLAGIGLYGGLGYRRIKNYPPYGEMPYAICFAKDFNLPQVRPVDLRRRPELADQAAAWFHAKWGIPQELYRESMEESLTASGPIPRWFLALEGDKTIVGGLGVIENDFHPRKDLRPNVCAVYVEQEYRGQGIAGMLLDRACRELQRDGVHTLYLLADIEGFYERWGWEFYCMVDGGEEESSGRMYVHRF